MALVHRFSPLNEIDTLHSQMNRLFNEIATWDKMSQDLIKPVIELFDNENSLILKIYLPGINKKDLDISVTHEQVKISGEYHRNQENKDTGYYISEFNYGKFERTIKLPMAVQNEQVTADYTDGVLTLNLPKVEEKNKVFKVILDNQALEAETHK